MLTKRIIPCLDVKAGRVVKGVKFLDHRDAGDPVEMANRYNTSGADELVFYDITASVEGRGIMQDVVSRVADQIFIPLTVGGGLRTIEDMKQMLESGADKVSVNTAAVENPHLISESADRFGSQCIVLGLDAIRVSGDANRWEVKVKTGRDGGNRTGLDAVEWAIRAAELGAGEVVVNRQHRKYPNPDIDNRHHVVNRQIAGYTQAAYRRFPWNFFIEVFSIPDAYSSSAWLSDRNGLISYNDPTRSLYEFVDDDDDFNGIPEWQRVTQLSSERAWPGMDENVDFIHDYNQIKSRVFYNYLEMILV